MARRWTALRPARHRADASIIKPTRPLRHVVASCESRAASRETRAVSRLACRSSRLCPGTGFANRIRPVTHASIRPNTLRIEPTRGWVALRLSEVVAYRELLFFLVWRDLKVRYKQTILGVAWAVLQPLLTMLVFALFFGRLARVPSDGVPYPLFAYTALVPWTFFAT